MAKLIFLFLVAIGVTTVHSNLAFLPDIDDMCEMLPGGEVAPNHVGEFHLRIVEFLKFGWRTHSLFPSAATSLLQSKDFDPKLETVIFLHGFTDSPLFVSGQSFAAAYRKHGNYNILALDASSAIKMFYKRSVTMVRFVGEYLAVFLFDLESQGVDVSKVHLVGHSLGAHIGGFAGKYYTFLRPGKKLTRVTGMDPAGPCFFQADKNMRLDADDAHFVDIIHTNIGVYGINKTIGHVDFYPNMGGKNQPGCIESVCSHNRVWELYEESVRFPNNFIGVSCTSKSGNCDSNNKLPMGFATPNTARGEYYLHTKALFPRGMGEAGAKQ